MAAGRPEIFEEALTNSIALSAAWRASCGRFSPARSLLSASARWRRAAAAAFWRRARAVAEGGRGALHRLRRRARRPGRHAHQRDQRPRHVRRRLSVPRVDARRAGRAQFRRRSAPAGFDPRMRRAGRRRAGRSTSRRTAPTRYEPRGSAPRPQVDTRPLPPPRGPASVYQQRNDEPISLDPPQPSAPPGEPYDYRRPYGALRDPHRCTAEPRAVVLRSSARARRRVAPRRSVRRARRASPRTPARSR